MCKGGDILKKKQERSVIPGLTGGRRTAFCVGEIAMLVISSACLGLLNLYFASGNYGLSLLKFFCGQPLLLLLNILPFFLLALVIWLLSGRVWLAFTVDGVFCLFYSWAEFWKLMARNDPIYAEDLTVIKEAAEMSGRYISITWQIVVSFLLVVIGIAVLLLLFRKKRKCFCPVIFRLLLAVLVILGSFGLYWTVYRSDDLYNSFPVSPEVNQWIESSVFVSRGSFYPFLHSVKDAVPQKPEDYDREEAEQVLASYSTDPIPEKKKVSVVCVMLEAFEDLSDDVPFSLNGDPYADFHVLCDESYHGTLVTNIFAGGTIDTERCVLTGFSALTSFRRTSWSYARYFEENGYALNGSHAGNENFYSRNVVNYNLGFENYLFLENYYKNFSKYIPSDHIFLPEVANLCLEDMKKGTPVFSYNVTYQNHGPYAADKLNTFEKREYVPKGVISDPSYYILNNYFNGVSETGKELKAMTDRFRETEEPVILVFFGDHKPWLGEQNSVYQELGVDLTSDTNESFYNYYTTEYLFWANDAAKAVLDDPFTGEAPTVSPCFLMNVLFEKCGWSGPAFLKLSNEVMAALPVVSTNGYYGENAVPVIASETAAEGGDYPLLGKDELSSDEAELLRKMDATQYYLSRDADGVMPSKNK